MRQGRKACTLITGYEPFLVVDAEEMAEELRKACAGATSSAFFKSNLLEKGRADGCLGGQFLRFRENLRTLAWKSWFKGSSQRWWWSI